MSETHRELVRCPKCGSTDVRYSYTQSTWDLIVDMLFSMDAFRCRSCRTRFHKFDPGDRDDDRFKSDEHKAQDAAERPAEAKAELPVEASGDAAEVGAGAPETAHEKQA